MERKVLFLPHERTVRMCRGKLDKRQGKYLMRQLHWVPLHLLLPSLRQFPPSQTYLALMGMGKVRVSHYLSYLSFLHMHACMHANIWDTQV